MRSDENFRSKLNHEAIFKQDLNVASDEEELLGNISGDIKGSALVT